MPLFTNTISALSKVGSALDDVKAKSDSLVTTLVKNRGEIEAAHKDFDALGALLEQSRETQNDFSQEFEFQLQRLKIGGQSIAAFLADFGDAQIKIGDGFKTIREALEGANLDQYRQELQQLISDVTTGGADLGKVLEFLKENAGDIAKGLINVLELFRQGKATL
ncbi:MAG: hypothetical protein ABIV06_12325, partial [Thermoanaerobaculia bacterium]